MYSFKLLKVPEEIEVIFRNPSKISNEIHSKFKNVLSYHSNQVERFHCSIIPLLFTIETSSSYFDVSSRADGLITLYLTDGLYYSFTGPFL